MIKIFVVLENYIQVLYAVESRNDNVNWSSLFRSCPHITGWPTFFFM